MRFATNQYGVLWAASGSDEFGQLQITQPVEFSARWELGAILSDSPLASTHRLVGRAFVDRVIPLESIVWKGTLEDYRLLNEPGDLMQVVDYAEVPNVKANRILRTVLLTAWNSQLPTGA